MKININDKSHEDVLKVNFLGKELNLAHDDYLKRRTKLSLNSIQFGETKKSQPSIVNGFSKRPNLLKKGKSNDS